ncbi:bcl-2-like protein 10 [Diceros bicornis minor]|uniref:bcl-2-like protein 10 n=1 Tax=Diceros bicornis minor TaxID=77932 RepID=UPI0026F323AA|nr:bcl-2-like protein 10 [Diceros bicornis minor]
MADALRERTARLLTDCLEYCAREPGTAAGAQSTPEAAVLRCVAAQIQQRNQLPPYRGFRGDRVELVAQMAQAILGDRHVPSWGRVAALVTFVGTLLETPPPGTYRKRKRGYKLDLKEWKAGVDQDCPRLVALLCAWLTRRHRAWLEAPYGWESAAGRREPRRTGRPGPRDASPVGPFVSAELGLSV